MAYYLQYYKRHEIVILKVFVCPKHFNERPYRKLEHFSFGIAGCNVDENIENTVVVRTILNTPTSSESVRHLYYVANRPYPKL